MIDNHYLVHITSDDIIVCVLRVILKKNKDIKKRKKFVVRNLCYHVSLGTRQVVTEVV